MFMKTINSFFLIVSLSLIVNSCTSNVENITSENITSTITTLGGTNNDSAQSIAKTNDGGYALLGFTQSTDGNIEDKITTGYDYWVLKYNAAHELEWSKTYGGSAADRGTDIIQTSDGGFALIGSSQSSDEDVSNNEGSKDYWMVKLNASGAIVWQKSFGFSGLDDGFSLIQTNDSGYLLTGVLDVTASGGLGNSRTSTTLHAGGDYWIIKLDAGGEKQWSKYFGGTFTDTPYSSIQTEDDGYIIVGSSDSNDVDINNNKGTYDFWIAKIDASGVLIWEKSFGGSQIDEARDIINSGDGNYLIVGDSRSNDFDISSNNGAADLWIIKISPNGDLIWEKSFGGSNFDAGRSVYKTTDNGFLICGSSRSSNGDLNINQGQNDVWVFKIDSDANLQWQKSFGGSGIDFAYDVTQLNNDTIIVVGDSNSTDNMIENKGFTDLLIVKLNVN